MCVCVCVWGGGGGGEREITKISNNCPSEYKPSFPSSLTILWQLDYDGRFKNPMRISCLLNFKKILPVKLCLPLGKLVPRVSPLPLPKEREEERPWERGWPLGFLSDSLWGRVTTEKIKTILIVK